MAARSPTPQDEIPQNPKFYVGQYLPHEAICIGHNYRDCETRRSSDFCEDLATYGVIVPGTMRGRYGLWKNPPKSGPFYSQRTNSNVAQQVFAIYRSSTKSIRKQVDAIWALHYVAPLAIVVQSDEEILEAWFSIKGMKDTAEEFLQKAIKRGSDIKIKTPCHPYAMPGGIIAETKFRHRVIYLDKPALAQAHLQTPSIARARNKKPNKHKKANHKKANQPRRKMRQPDQTFIAPPNTYGILKSHSPVSRSKIPRDSHLCGRSSNYLGKPLFVVFALESGSLDQQAMAIFELKHFCRLNMIVESDSKHIQAWFSIAGQSEQQTDRFRLRCLKLGAPESILNDCHPYALPWGWNHTHECEQPVVYWDPSVI